MDIFLRGGTSSFLPKGINIPSILCPIRSSFQEEVPHVSTSCEIVLSYGHLLANDTI